MVIKQNRIILLPIGEMETRHPGVDLLKPENARSGATLHRSQSASGFLCESLVEQAEDKS